MLILKASNYPAIRVLKDTLQANQQIASATVTVTKKDKFMLSSLVMQNFLVGLKGIQLS